MVVAIRSFALPGGVLLVSVPSMCMLYVRLDLVICTSPLLNIASIPPVALGQVMHRMRLSWYGGETGAISAASTCQMVTYLVVACIITDLILDAIGADDLRVVFRVAFFIYTVIAITKTRRYIRQKYSIPEKCCQGSGIEDCCCAYWCPCLTIGQMARHTANYYTYTATCCTPTGLSPDVPAMV